jgi:hypothetical protein
VRNWFNGFFRRTSTIRGFSARVKVVFVNGKFQNQYTVVVSGQSMDSDRIVIQLHSIIFDGLHLFHSPRLKMEIVFDDEALFEVEPTGCERDGETWTMTLAPKNRRLYDEFLATQEQGRK